MCSNARPHAYTVYALMCARRRDASQQILSQGTRQGGAMPVKPRRADAGCADTSMPYSLPGRVDLPTLPDVTGLILDGSGYAYKDHNYYDI